MSFTCDQAGPLECVHEVCDITGRAAQELAQLSLRPARLPLKLPEDFSPRSREAAFRESRVHACSQHHAQRD
jgi:hypothetical protein